MTYPVTIVDDFFDDPDEIVELAESLKWYPPETGNWPGLRTKQLHLENERLFNYIGEKIHHIFHDTIPTYWELQAHFQKINLFQMTSGIKETKDGYIKTLTHGLVV